MNESALAVIPGACMRRAAPILVVVALCAYPALPSIVCAADSYPARPVRLIVPFPSGGGTDILARLLANELGTRWGTPVVVDNRGGAGGSIGAEAAARAAPDGYTLFIGQTGQLAINPTLFAKLPYDPVRDFTPISMVASQPLILVSHPDLAARTVRELVSLANARPGTLNFSSAGNGSLSHLAGELFRSITGSPIVHVPYRGGGPAVTELIGGQVQLTFNVIPGVMPHVRAGRLRALAVTYQPAQAVDVPTMAQAGVAGYDIGSWFGLLGPVGISEALTSRLNRDVQIVLAHQELRRKLAEQGVEAVPGTALQFAGYIRSELVRWKRAVQASGAKAD